MANQMEVEFGLEDSDSDDENPRIPPGQPRRDRPERIALFDFLRLVAGNRELQPGFRTNAELVAHLKSNETLTSDAVSRAMLACPRDLFVPPPHRAEALADRPIRVEAAGFNISAPHVQAVALQALELQPGERVLDVGCGCGIVTAYAAYMSGSLGEVVGVDIRDSAISLASANLQRLRAQNIEFSEVAAPVRLERHNVFIPLHRHQGLYDAVHVGGALQESRLGAIVDLLGPRGGRIVAPVANELRLVTKSPDGVIRQRVLTQVSFSELEVPRDVDVVRALLQEKTEAARRVELPPSTFASDLAHLAAPGVDLARLQVEASDFNHPAAPAVEEEAAREASTSAAPAPPPDSPRGAGNGVRPRSVDSRLIDHLAPATLPPARRPRAREGAAAARCSGGAGTAAAAASGSGLAWPWERSAVAPLQRRSRGGSAAGGVEVDEVAGGVEEVEEAEPLLAAPGRSRKAADGEEAPAAPAGPIEVGVDMDVALAAVPAAGGEQAAAAGGGGLSYLAGIGEVLSLGPPDCELAGVNWRLPAHKAVLQARCELLRAHASSGMRDSDAASYLVPEVVERRDAVEAFLHYVYKDRLPDELGTDVVPQLLHTGIYFGCNRLVRLCEALLARELVAASSPPPPPPPMPSSASTSTSAASLPRQGASGRRTSQSGSSGPGPGPSSGAAGGGAGGGGGSGGGPDTEERLSAAVAAASPLLALADEGGLDGLRRVALNFILEHFPAVSASEGYRQLPRQLLQAVAAEAVGRYGELLRQLEVLGAQGGNGRGAGADD